MSESPDDGRARGGSSTTLILAIGIAVLLGLVELVAVQLFGRRASAPAPSPTPATGQAGQQVHAPASAPAPAR